MLSWNALKALEEKYPAAAAAAPEQAQSTRTKKWRAPVDGPRLRAQLIAAKLLRPRPEEEVPCNAA